MKPAVTVSGAGIVVEHDGRRILLDPSKSIEADVTFVSHAHMDHLHAPRNGERILTSQETSRLAGARGYSIERYEDSLEGFELIDSGHILGSRALLINDSILYTGDVSVRDRAFLRGARVPRCDTLILESTYGRPDFRFPGIDEVCSNVNTIISNLYSRGVPVILMGYALGKAQVLTSLFKHWKPLYLHDSVYAINKVCSDLGVDLGDGDAIPYSLAQREDLLRRRPWMMVAPKTSAGSKFVLDMKERYNAVTIGFTGWAMANWYKYSSGLDYVIPMSDHCDFPELVSLVEACSPSKVYTFHGYSTELALQLSKLGYDAEPLIRNNYKLTDFAAED